MWKLIYLFISFSGEGKLLERRCLGDFNSGAHWSDISTDECSTTKSDITKELFLLRNVIIFTFNNFLGLFYLPYAYGTEKKKESSTCC